jgi:hypothetical protein
MAIQTMNPDQILSLERHLTQAAQLDSGTIQLLRTLADQLHGKSVLPVLCLHDSTLWPPTSEIDPHFSAASRFS